MALTVSYKSTAADDRYLTELVVGPDGVGRLVVRSNRDQRTLAVGRFEGPLTSSLSRRLAAGAVAPALASAPSETALLPDESYREIRVVVPGAAPLTKLLREEGPPPVANLERVLLEVISHLRQSPVAALTMRMAIPRTVVAGTSLDLELTPANVGRAPLRLPAPASWGEDGVTCDLMVLRVDVPASALGLENQRFVPIGATNLTSSDSPIAADEIVLGPGEEIRLRFRTSAEWPIGNYMFELGLEITAVGSDGKHALDGGLVSEAKDVDVVRG